MNFIYSILMNIFIAFANSIDNIAVGASYSLKGRKVPIMKNIYMAFMASVVAGVSSYTGDLLSQVVSEKAGAIICLILFILIGIRLLVDAYPKGIKSSHIVLQEISFKEATVVGFALAIDDIGGGVSAGLIGLNPAAVGAAFAMVSIIIFSVGNRGASYFNKSYIGRRASLLSGVIMIIVGLLQLF